MEFEKIKEKIEELSERSKEHLYDIYDMQDLFELDKPLEDTEKELQTIGLSLEDFRYTGFHIFPFRFIKDVTMMDMHSISMEEIRFHKLVERANNQTEYAIDLLRENKFNSFISFVDKRMKMNALEIFYEDIPSVERYDVFREVYARIEYNFQDHREFIINCFKDRFCSQDWNSAKINLFKETKGNRTITIYRGEGSKSSDIKNAFSWTLDKSVAEFFAKRFDSDGVVYKANISFDDVIDYIEHRNEKEILVDYTDLNSIGKVRGNV